MLQVPKAYAKNLHLSMKREVTHSKKDFICTAKGSPPRSDEKPGRYTQKAN